MKILVTYGGTREDIDGVRHIGNFSSGKTGKTISNYLIDSGCELTILRSADSDKITNKFHQKLTFKSSQDLKDQLYNELSKKNYDALIMMAAVSDWLIDYAIIDGAEVRLPIKCKISSDSEVSLKLKPNEKIISSLQEFSKNKQIKIVAFKLTHGANESEKLTLVKKLLTSPGVSFCIHNELSEIVEEKHPFTLYSSSGAESSGQTKGEMAKALLSTLKETV